jgi:hypothetical protein
LQHCRGDNKDVRSWVMEIYCTADGRQQDSLPEALVIRLVIPLPRSPAYAKASTGFFLNIFIHRLGWNQM